MLFSSERSYMYKGTGGAALNSSGTLVAIVDSLVDAVHFFSMPRTRGGTATLQASFSFPEEPFRLRAEHLCFASRSALPETLLIADFNNDRVVEISTSGKLLRTIALVECGGPRGVAFDAIRRLIAVSLTLLHIVVFVDYDSGVTISTIGTMGVPGQEHGSLCAPNGVRFTHDHLHVLVADGVNHRVSKFAIEGGVFQCHVASGERNGITGPTDVVEVPGDGSLLVADDAGRVTHVSNTGGTKDVMEMGRALVTFLVGTHFVYVKDKVGEIHAVPFLTMTL
jgi:DNA-binding beta-propeller fold protein YncE